MRCRGLGSVDEFGWRGAEKHLTILHASSCHYCGRIDARPCRLVTKPTALHLLTFGRKYKIFTETQGIAVAALSLNCERLDWVKNTNGIPSDRGLVPRPVPEA